MFFAHWVMLESHPLALVVTIGHERLPIHLLILSIKVLLLGLALGLIPLNNCLKSSNLPFKVPLTLQQPLNLIVLGLHGLPAQVLLEM